MRMQSEFETNSSTTASLSAWAISHHHNLTISHPITHRSHNLEFLTYMQITPHHCHRIIIIVQKILLLVVLQEVLLVKWPTTGGYWESLKHHWFTVDLDNYHSVYLNSLVNEHWVHQTFSNLLCSGFDTPPRSLNVMILRQILTNLGFKDQLHYLFTINYVKKYDTFPLI